ncbi:hypothetical protein CMUS01_05852 [Colletotrichum musicola]|uniref:Uncharacterized protein n=1 Tax=Colletotrichum musicola TaxID=2175873 RepID=A0A8H6KPU8_9PEZI|nr:hypothetical protein CMUS01_05852 [Colletotrichum musicola]
MSPLENGKDSQRRRPERQVEQGHVVIVRATLLRESSVLLTDALCKARRLGSAVGPGWTPQPPRSPCMTRGESGSSRTLRRPDRLTGLIQVGDDALQPQFPPATKCAAANWDSPAQPRLYDNTTLTSLDTTKRSPATKSADKRSVTQGPRPQHHIQHHTHAMRQPAGRPASLPGVSAPALSSAHDLLVVGRVQNLPPA